MSPLHQFAVLLTCLGAAGCDAPRTTRPSLHEVNATVRYDTVEGGCWALELDTGRVEPKALPDAFRVDGLQVLVSLEDAPDVMSRCQIGSIKRVKSIRRR